MRDKKIMEILDRVSTGSISSLDAYNELKLEPFKALGYANVDFHRKIRQGVGEVIFGQGKTAEQICGIVNSLVDSGANDIIITRINVEVIERLKEENEVEFHEEARIAIVAPVKDGQKVGNIVVASGGTSDIPVCEEAAVTAEALGSRVIRLYDVGVAGIHRLLANVDVLNEARVVIAVAGMEGALPSVVSGLVDCPVIAVPTSIGYGASFNGIAALLAMLNSCASGVSVVNIDNGFGAGYIANMINKTEGYRV